jgi:hypothetical protein
VVRGDTLMSHATGRRQRNGFAQRPLPDPHGSGERHTGARIALPRSRHHQIHLTTQGREGPARAAPLGLVPWERVVAARHAAPRANLAPLSPETSFITTTKLPRYKPTPNHQSIPTTESLSRGEGLGVRGDIVLSHPTGRRQRTGSAQRPLPDPHGSGERLIVARSALARSSCHHIHLTTQGRGGLPGPRRCR